MYVLYSSFFFFFLETMDENSSDKQIKTEPIENINAPMETDNNGRETCTIDIPEVFKLEPEINIDDNKTAGFANVSTYTL